MNKFFSLCLFCLLQCILVSAETKRALFIGNSYTAVNDLPNTVKNLALSMGDTLIVDSYTPGGYTFNMHSTDANALAKIQLGNWDFVVLQAQSQEPSFPPAQVQTQTYPYAATLDSLIHVFNPCAETVFYMTWGRKNGDAANCASYPVICTYEGMQMRLRESYLEMTQDNQASCSPVGVAWRTFRNLYPGVELYQPDESHPSTQGTYLAACVFYSTFYRKHCKGAQFMPAGVTTSDGYNAQVVASATVLDSVENWQQYGHLPWSFFTSTQNGTQVNFTNASKRAINYTWNFGDGNNSTVMNPQHTYATAGTYVVSLKASSVCNQSHVYTDTVVVSSGPNALDPIKKIEITALNYQGGTLYWNIPTAWKKAILFNALGQQVKVYPSGKNEYRDTLELPNGNYTLKLISIEGNSYTGRLQVSHR